MTTQELYNKVLAEEVTQQKFLYEVRRDINLPFITASNNFKDTVQILKNKGMISEKKLSTGKQDIEIYAKTIDMVNPYEYTRGMDYELGVVVDAIGNRIADNAGDSMHIEDLTKDDVLKAQKKVLKNLTKNPQYYQQKLIPQMEGETELPVEVNAKSIEALKKKAGKVIREHGEDYEAVSKVMGNVSQLEEDSYTLTGEESKTFKEKVKKFTRAKNFAEELVALKELDKLYAQLDIRQMDVNDYEEIVTDPQLKLGLDEFKTSETNSDYILALQAWKQTGSDIAYRNLVKASKANDMPLPPPKSEMNTLREENVYGAGVKKGDEIAAKKMATKRESIYEKYAQKYGVDVNEVKDRLEAYKLKQEEAIEVEDEATAISVQKKSPDADVRIIEK